MKRERTTGNRGTRVCVGMSGGVDSSVAAYLLKQQGYDVIGLTFRGWPQDCRSIEEDKCCGPQAVADARMVAHSLDIPYYVIDEIDTFRREVMDYFAAEYKRGRTPNPCVICNEKVKFGSLLRKARALGVVLLITSIVPLGDFAIAGKIMGYAAAIRHLIVLPFTLLLGLVLVRRPS